MPSNKIILDCDLMKHRNSGLYYYCLNLGLHVKKILDAEANEKIFFYGDPADLSGFHDQQAIIEQRSWPIDKLRLGVSPLKWYQRLFKKDNNSHTVWHAPFQSGRILPDCSERVKVLLTIHDLNPLHEDIFTDEQRAASIKHTQKLIDKSSALVCISEYCKQDVLNHLDIGDKTLHVIHNGTTQMPVPAITPAGYQPERPFLFTLGYINRKKNFHTLIPILATQPHLELIVAGKPDEPDYLANMEKQANDLGVADRFHVVGQITDEDKAWYYKNCTAFMFPSVAEGFGLPVTEAMAFGKPLFLSHRTSLPEIGGNVASYFTNFDPSHMQSVFAEGMTRYETEGLYQKIIDRGNDFNWEKSAREYINVYRSLF
jgi:glycosyltransferase involved in cell wall biosynthesis